MSVPTPPESWSRLASLVDTLLDSPPERRAALISELSAGDPAQRAMLEALLEECEREPAMFRRSAPEVFGGLFAEEIAEFPRALAERYQAIRELGRGGMATVYLARDLKHGRDVAVKVVRPAMASVLGPDRFLREIEIVARLRHPHIVPLFDSGEADGALYFVMPFEAGLSLRRRLEEDGPLAPEAVVPILRDICDALAHAHEHGVVHRDIKPDNVLLSGGHAMVADFGVATAPADAAPGAALGTPAYMAPEQIESDPGIDHRADIYSLGVLAYELLTGAPPFTGAPRVILSAHLVQAPVPIGDRRPDVPPALAELIMKCLAKLPADRWQTAQELIPRLDALAHPGSRSSRGYYAVAAVAVVALAAVALIARQAGLGAGDRGPERWASARFERLTDFPGSEVDAAISTDGRTLAFLADRDGGFDAFVGEVGSGQFANLTGGRLPQLYNEDVRNIGFSADAEVWVRVAGITSPASVSMMPAQGGAMRPFLPTAVMATWSPDGSRLAYHETTPGDPVYVADSDGSNPRKIFAAQPGVHCHHLSWSPDGRYLYFTYGVPPDDMDVWRVAVAGGPPERITSHNSRVAYPVAVDDRTLIYTATADDGTGPWLYGMNVNNRVAVRWSTGVEHYLSIAAGAAVPDQPRRLVATVSNPSVRLWTVPIDEGIAAEEAATPLVLPVARSAAPRFAPDSSLFYLASRSGADGVWRLQGGSAAEIWSPGQGGVIGAVALSPDGRTICFPVRSDGRSTLHCADADGTGVRPVADSLDVRGAASWSPDGRWLAVGAMDGPGVRVFKVPLDGGQPVRLVDSVSSNPVWSPDGRVILYSGTARARSVPLKAVTPDGAPVPVPPLLVDRVGDSYRFFPGGRRLVVKLGGFRRQDFWMFDLETGQQRQLTRLTPGESLQRFDVSPDGKRVVFERVRENSDVVLVELPRP